MLVILEKGRQDDLAENGRRAVIARELSNLECYYTGDIRDAVDRLESYGITEDEIREVYNEERLNQDF